MDYSGASAFIYAKVSGMLSKSFIGNDAAPLFSAKSLAELWELVFHSPVPQIPEMLLANKIENEAVKRFVAQYIQLLECYSSPNSFLTELLRRYDVENVKVLSAALAYGETERPRIVSITPYSELKYDAWPSLKAVTAGSTFDWYGALSDEQRDWQADWRLDLQEIRLLWRALNHISDSSRTDLVAYYRKYYAVRNMLWALRLKVYYTMEREEIVRHLFYVGDEPCASDPICGYAFEILDKDVASREEWAKWSFAEFLNPVLEESKWVLDPVWVEQKFRFVETKSLKRIFHANPMTYASLVCFFMLKRHELDCIRAATEALRLNADSSEGMYAAGIVENFARGGY